VPEDSAIADWREATSDLLGTGFPTLQLRQGFFDSSGFDGAGGLAMSPPPGLSMPPGLAGAAAPPVAGALVSDVVSSELQPDTKTSARTRLESIVQVLIPDFTLTDALLEEKHETRQGIPISLPQLTHASGPYVPKTIRETILPHIRLSNEL